jgi:signal transduction histidine kinase
VPPGEIVAFFAVWEELLRGAEQFKPELFPEGIFYTEAYIKYGCFGIDIRRQLTDDEKEVIRRFAVEFERTYTRFLDLKKAEAQALQAEQDLIAIKEARRNAEEALTELKATQSQLIHAEKMASLGELTAGIAHEIQNPLNFVNNFSEVSAELVDEMKQELAVGSWQSAGDIAEDIKSNLEKIHHHGKRADAIVKGMLQHSRTSTGQKEPTDINALADEYLRLAYHGLRAKDKSFNAEFITDFDENLIKVNVIPQDIGRVLLNLINNAFYAVTDKNLSGFSNLTGLEYKPTVIVSTKRLENAVEIRVRDNGPGIPEEIKDKIFQPFFTTKPTGQGTGLGLSLSYDIVKAHGGELKLETKEGEGTEFIIVLPEK